MDLAWRKTRSVVGQKSPHVGTGVICPWGMPGSAAVPSQPARLLQGAHLTCSLRRNRMSQGDANPAAVPHAAEDIQGDDRWMSQVRFLGWGGRGV